MLRRRQFFTGALVAAGLIFVAAVLPLPLYLIAPGSAIDLSDAVTVGSLAPPRDRFFLTDVQLIRASPLRLAFALFPGVSLTRAELVVPEGVSVRRFGDVMQDAMTQSQSIAAVVAERAAGLAVQLPLEQVEVEAIDAASAARGVLAVGDVIRNIDRLTVRGDADVRAALSAKRPGSAVRIAIDRAGRRRVVTVRTVRIGGRTRLGIVLAERYGPAQLAIPVRYTIGDVGGSSGGLMIALRIYGSLHASPAGAARSFAGTGTIGLDGRIGPIEGTQQKLIAAKRAGARVFFVPRTNYADIAGERDIRVIPVDTFGQAVRALVAVPRSP
jgi:PDZ domain-containing protein